MYVDGEIISILLIADLNEDKCRNLGRKKEARLSILYRYRLKESHNINFGELAVKFGKGDSTFNILMLLVLP